MCVCVGVEFINKFASGLFDSFSESIVLHNSRCFFVLVLLRLQWLPLVAVIVNSVVVFSMDHIARAVVGVPTPKTSAYAIFFARAEYTNTCIANIHYA